MNEIEDAILKIWNNQDIADRALAIIAEHCTDETPEEFILHVERELVLPRYIEFLILCGDATEVPESRRIAQAIANVTTSAAIKILLDEYSES